MKNFSRNCFSMETVDMTTKKASIILASIKFICSSKRFDGQLIDVRNEKLAFAF